MEEMTGNQKIYAFSAAVVLVLLVVLGIAYVASKKQAASPVATAPAGTASTTNPNPGYTIQQVPATSLQDLEPDLNHKIVFSASVPADAQAALQQTAARLVAQLKKDPTNAGNWFDLAIAYHEANDFDAARLVWEFLTKVIAPPYNAVAYENLGKLYHFDLKNFPKAESYFTLAMKADPKSLDPYLELFELYTYSYKQTTTAAVDILHKAAAQFPADSAPLIQLGNYYRDKSDTADARAAYNKALDRARAAGDTAAMAEIGSDISNLPQ